MMMATRTVTRAVFLFLILCLFTCFGGSIEHCGEVTVNNNKSLSRNEFQKILFSSKGLKFVHQNICNLENKFNELEEFVYTHDGIDIISLSETHLQDDVSLDYLKLNGYHFLGKCRKNGLGGGVCIFIKNNIKFKKRSDLTKSSLEGIWIEIAIKKSKPIIFGCFYRPPETSKYFTDDFDALLNETLRDIEKEQKEVILMGDFNINYNSKSNKQFKDMMKMNGFKQIITSPTRITKDSSSLIDLSFVNKPAHFPKSNVIESSLSDHEMIYCHRKMNSQKYPMRSIKCRNYRSYDPAQLLIDANEIDWSPIYTSNNVNNTVSFFQTSLKTLFDKHAPYVEKRVRGQPCSWLNENVKTEMNRRDCLLRKAKKNNDEHSWREYKNQRNRCTNLIRKTKGDFHKNLLHENNFSPKRFWSVIKMIYPLKSKVFGQRSFDLKERAMNFGNYFSNVVSKLKSAAFPLVNFVWRYHKKDRLRTKSIFSFSPVSSTFVEKELRKLKRNKAAGSDCLPPNLLKDCYTAIAKPMAHIINLSLRSGIVPTAWKSAKITPIFKSGDTKVVSNYRPISVLPVLSKILERAVHNQLYEYMEHNDLLSDCQFGFRKKRSTKLATTIFCDKVRKHIDKGCMVGALFLDLSKAFDTIGHGILLEKFVRYGVLGDELCWFTDYLFNRSQQVEVDGSLSEIHHISSGVPQGSILGPLMFIIFFNDLHDIIQHCEMFQYADDTVILFPAKSVAEIEYALNSDLEAIGSYCYDNELLLNLKVGKTESILFGTAQRLSRHGRNLNLVYNNTPINFVTEYVYLGNLLDNHMSLSKNFDRSYKKACGRLRLLRYVRYNLTTATAEMIYNMMIVPILTYGSTLKTCFTITQLSKFASIDRRASQIVGKTTMKSIKSTLDSQVSNLVVKCLNNSFGYVVLDSYFERKTRARVTRNSEFTLKLPHIKLETARASFYFGGVKIFNELPLDFRKTILT